MLSAIWGSSFIFIKISVDTIHPALLTSYRLIIASIFLYFFCNVEKIKNLLQENKVDLFIIAVFGNVLPFNLISWSEVYVESVIASTLIGTMPLFTFLISLFIIKKTKFSIETSLGILIGFIGMLIFIKPDSLLSSNNIYFPILILIASIMYAFSANWVKKLNYSSSIELAFCSIAVAAALSIPIFFISLNFSNFNMVEVFKIVQLDSLISATILGIVCTGLAVSLFFYLIRVKSAVFASQSNYLIPCFGFLWSYIFLSEKLTTNLFVGLILIVLGGYIVNMKKRKN